MPEGKLTAFYIKYQEQEDQDEKFSENSSDIETAEEINQEINHSEINQTRLQAIAAQLNQMNPLLCK